MTLTIPDCAKCGCHAISVIVVAKVRMSIVWGPLKMAEPVLSRVYRKEVDLPEEVEVECGGGHRWKTLQKGE